MPIVITHLSGPLAGTSQTFNDDHEDIVFGRSENADVKYPQTYALVSGEHFLLKRDIDGSYRVKLLGNKYVSVDGHEAYRDHVIAPGAAARVFQLGRKNGGPTFKVSVLKSSVAGYLKTRTQDLMEGVQGRLRKLELRTGSALAVAFVLIAAVGAGVAYVWTEQDALQKHHLALEEAFNRKHFSRETISKLERASYMVVRLCDGFLPRPVGTAWAFEETRAGTNAHVIAAIEDPRYLDCRYVLRGPGTNYKDVMIVGGLRSHPGYAEFRASLKVLQETAVYRSLTTMVSVYDVGIINVSSETRMRDTLQLASNEELAQLAAGQQLAFAGYPSEGLAGSDVNYEERPPTVQGGLITSVTDVFMLSPDEPDQGRLLQVSLPVTGGASGSPVITPQGKVVAIINAGNMNRYLEPSEGKSQGAENAKRAPSAALVNFAQRVDMLQDLIDGRERAALERDKLYWAKRAERFHRYIDVAAESFQRRLQSQYKTPVEAVQLQSVPASGVLRREGGALSSLTLQIPVESGWNYGFIGYAEKETMLGMRFRDKNGEHRYLGNAIAPFVEVLSPAGETVALTLYCPPSVPQCRSMNELRYELRGYRWR